MESVVAESRASMVLPFCYILAQGILAAVTIHRTTSQSPWRLLTLGIVIWLAYLEFASAVNNRSSGFSNSTITAYSWLYTVQLVNILWINNVSSEDFKAPKVHTKGHLPHNSFWSVLNLVAFNFRGIRTPWKAKNIPPFSTYYPGRIPQSRIQFLLRQVAILMLQYLVIDITIAQFSKLSPEDILRLMGPGVEFTYLSATREQWIFRLSSTLASRWFVGRCFLSGLYNFISIVGVATGIFSIENFPPFMGSMWSSYTIRGYWGKFWHQSLRWPHTALSTLITRDVLHLPKPSLLERYSSTFLAFTFSGILHVFIDLGNGKTELSPTMLYFQSFAFGVMIEDGIQALWRMLAGEKFGDSDDNVATWKKIVGFVWVFSFLMIVAPWYMYPSARELLGRNTMMSMGITQSIGEKAAVTTLVVLGSILRLVFKTEI